MGILLMIVAALFVAISNLCMRKSIDAGGSSKAFLMIQLSIVFLVAILLNPVRMNDYHMSPCMIYFGLAGGIILAMMMICLGRALEIGPPGLTSASLSSATVMPALLMTFLFGAQFGFVYNAYHATASIFVILGLFWAGWGVKGSEKKRRWVAFVTGAFVLHALFLVMMQWRALFVNFPGENGLFLNFDIEGATSQWFMPAVFFAAALVQVAVFVFQRKRTITSKEIWFGLGGGLTNGVGTFFMIQATERATSVELAMIFPLFAVGLILFCNLWGRFLYQERVNWLANGLCIVGVVIGTVNWSALLS